MLSDQTLSRINEVVPPEVTHVGLVLQDGEGGIAISTPAKPKFGVTRNIPRVMLRGRETAAQAVVRCATDTIQCRPVSVFPIDNVWSTPNSKTFYFAGFAPEHQPYGPGDIYWYSPTRARAELESVKYAPTRERNLGVLDQAGRMCVSPYRRVLEMVRELHRMGYERLRAPAYLYPLAWRCPVVPATWTLKEHGGLFHEPSLCSKNLLAEGSTTYSSAGGQDVLFKDFSARNIEFASARDLATEVVRLRPRLAFAGWGPDSAYVKWFEKALETLGPNGLFFAFGEYQEPKESLYTDHSSAKMIPLPPPGWSTQREWDEFDERHPPPEV